MAESASESAQNKTLATWIFGGLLLFFILGVFVFAPERLPEYKQRILALTSAILAGLFGYFLTGSIGIKFKELRTKFGDVTVDAAGGFALFVLVLAWWSSPFAPVNAGDGIAVVRVTVLGSDKMPIEDAQVWSSIGGESKKVAGGWEVEFPISKLPENRKITVYAAQRSAYLKGQREITVNEGKPTVASIQLDRDTSAQVKGTISDGSGKPLVGASVSIVGSASSSTTDARGFFSLSANAAVGEEIRLRVSQAGYEMLEQYHPAGDDPAYIVLQRKRR
jgi:hypothetical protein